MRMVQLIHNVTLTVNTNNQYSILTYVGTYVGNFFSFTMVTTDQWWAFVKNTQLFNAHKFDFDTYDTVFYAKTSTR